MEQKQQLPNATAVLVMGILSLVLSCFYGLGLVLGIIGVVLGNKGKKLYRSNPDAYLGYGNLNAGWIMSIIGLCLSALYIILIVIFGAAYFAAISSMM